MNSLREIQLVQLEIMIAFDRICKKHDITYQLFAGTLLGAVRHKGFIPWDDDVDVCMLRPEYDRFLEIAQQELDPDYFVQNTYTDPEYYNIFTRIRKNGTFFDQPTYQEFNFHKGIFIDIFPLDNLPGNWFRRVAKTRSLALLRFFHRKFNKLRKIENVTKVKNPLKRLLKHLGHFVACRVSNAFMTRLQDAICVRHNRKETALVTHLTDGALRNRWFQYRMKRTDVLDSIMLEFEGHDFPAPRNYDFILRQIYGDYLQLPPEEERFPHHLE